jgi:hypothetical protein
MSMGKLPIIKASTLALTLAAAIGAAALSGVPQSPAARAQAEGENKPDDPRARRVCRTLTPSGTRMTRRVCRTQEEWDRAMERTQDGVLQHQINNSTLLQQAKGPI